MQSRHPTNVLVVVAILPFFLAFYWFGFFYAWWPQSDPFDGRYLVYHKWRGAPAYVFAIRPSVWWANWLLTRCLIVNACASPFIGFACLLASAHRPRWYSNLPKYDRLFVALWVLTFASWLSLPLRSFIVPGKIWSWIYIEGWDGTFPPPGAKQLPP